MRVRCRGYCDKKIPNWKPFALLLYYLFHNAFLEPLCNECYFKMYMKWGKKE